MTVAATHYVAHVTPSDGITRRFALVSFDLDDARREAMRLAAAMFGRGFTFTVRVA